MNVSKKVAIIFSVVGLAAGAAGTVAFQTQAAGNGSNTTGQTGMKHMRGVLPAAAGSVTAVNGNSITVTDKRTGTSYTVDVSSATIQKITPPAAGTTPSTSSGSSGKPVPTTITASQIAIGDNVMVQGTVSGTSIKATKIVDGMMMGRGFKGGFGGHGAAGTVSAISGSTITLTGRDGKTYTINAGSAAVKKITTGSISDIKVGDTLMANGSTSGTTITATQIVDGALGVGK